MLMWEARKKLLFILFVNLERFTPQIYLLTRRDQTDKETFFKINICTKYQMPYKQTFLHFAQIGVKCDDRSK